MDWYIYPIAILGGFVAGIINTLAGNGSAITLSILTEVIGLPGNLANGTNRVGVLMQGLAGTLSFYKNGRLNIQSGKGIIAYTFIGAVVGVIVAVKVSSESFMSIFRILMVLMLIVILVNPKRWFNIPGKEESLPPFVEIPVFLALGFYGGFIQMGMGVFFLAAMVLVAKYNLIDANAIKVLVVMLYTIIVIAIFQWRGMINWEVGLVIGVGQMAGGWLAAKYASAYANADIWAYRLLVIIIIAAILKLFIF